MVTMEEETKFHEQALEYIEKYKPSLTQLAEEFIANKINAIVFMFAYLNASRNKEIVKGRLSLDATGAIWGACEDFNHLNDPTAYDEDCTAINEAEFRIRVQMCLEEKWDEARRRTIQVS